MWINSSGQIYEGDCVPGDRAATDAEMASWQAKIANPVPAFIAMWQMRAVLSNAGLLDKANAAVTAANNPVLSAFWEYATQIERASPTLANLATLLGITDAQLDQMFINGSKL